MVPLIGAISAGNTVLLKVSQKSFSTGQIIKKILSNVFPIDIVEVIGLQTDDREKFVNANTDFIFFTGSYDVGKKMALIAVEKMIPCVLELDGKSPAIITKNANLEISAKRLLLGKLINSGQTCVAPDYLLLHESKEKDFFNIAGKIIFEFYGKDILNNDKYGKIVDKKAMEKFVMLSKQANIYKESNFDFKQRKIEPLIFKADLDNIFMDSEIFGPFLPVITYKDLEEIPKIIKKHNYPLAMYNSQMIKKKKNFY